MADLPSGTVTFLFTDLESSTRLWEEHPDAMHDALARHDELVRQAIESQQGHVVKTTGDGFHAAFATAHDALDAAITAQRLLVTEPWESTGALRVRIGLHSGEARHREGDYYGPALNRAARLMSAGHGGQILLSGVTAELVQDSLRQGDCELSDLGEHRLQDLSRVEHVFQLKAPGLPAEFPALRSLDAFPGNLPLQTTSFVGRDMELGAVIDALADSRLVTLTGVGGVGKTRLALQAAAQMLPDFSDGVWLCELAVAGDPDAMVEVIATALGVSPRPDVALDAAVVSFLQQRATLLILDNCEHLLEAAGRQLDGILRSCAGVRVLATSREGLAVSGERVLPLRSLTMPQLDDPTDAVASTESARLFAQRANAAHPGFAIDAANSAAIGEICRRLDGVPLAIELAAARVNAMSPAEIARLLDERFRLLTGGRRTAVERHQTLRATVDWSYSLLEERDRTVFERLGVFVGSFDAAAATAVTAVEGIDPWDVLDALTGLVDKSMVQTEATAGDATRYSLLDTLRAYAREHLEEAGDVDRWRRRHAEHYAIVAEASAAGLTDAEPRSAIARFRIEVDNLRTAIDWASDSETAADIDFAIRIVASLGPVVVSYATMWAEQILPRAGNASQPQRARLLAAAAYAASNRGDAERAFELARAAIDLDIADAFTLGLAYSRLVNILTAQGKTDEGLAILAEARAALEARGGDADADTLLHIAAAHLFGATADPAATREAEEAVRLARSAGSHLSISLALSAYASLLAQSDPTAARAAAEECVARQRDGRESAAYGRVLALATLLRVRDGDRAGALLALREAISFHGERGWLSGSFGAIRRSVRVLESLGYPSAAAAMAGCADAAPAESGTQLPPLSEKQDEQRALDRIRDTIGVAQYDELVAEASTLSPDAAVGRAISIVDDLIATHGDG